MTQTFTCLALYFLTIIQTFGCICPTETIEGLQKRSLNSHELVFIGRVIETDTVKGFFKLKVLRVLKGKPGDEVKSSQIIDSLGNSSSCGYWPSGFWGNKLMVYADKVKGTDMVYIDACSLTRSMSHPNVHHTYPAGKLKDRKQRRQAKRNLRREIRLLKE